MNFWIAISIGLVLVIVFSVIGPYLGWYGDVDRTSGHRAHDNNMS